MTARADAARNPRHWDALAKLVRVSTGLLTGGTADTDPYGVHDRNPER
ncbi:MAG: hypothetical protein ABR881_29960 [Candidatus Sulfotelmatobacter sp.]|jgi:hypothetical protein